MDIDSILLKLKKSYHKNLPQLDAYRKKLYPDFVFEPNAKTMGGEIPVFTFHFVEPIQFEKQLQFLATNEYNTLTADEFLAIILGEKPIPEKAVVLTFDDGWGSLWTYAYPLLKKYGMHGISFIIPGMIHDVKTYFPNLCDVWAEKVSTNDLIEREKSPETLCTWSEIKKMSSSGAVEFQSHTMYHSLIFTSSQIIDFFNPSFDPYINNFLVPIFQSHGEDKIERKAEWGMPIYSNTPLMAGKRRYFDDEELRLQCIEFVHQNGDRDFFNAKGWRKELQKLVTDYKENFRDKGYYESDEELRESLYYSLVESKRLIEEKLPGKTVRHLCYPLYVGSQLAIDLSKEAGYMCDYWGLLENRRRNCPGDDPYHIVRLGEEFIFRLPGYGRKSLQNILGEQFLKNSRRFLVGLSNQIR